MEALYFQQPLSEIPKKDKPHLILSKAMSKYEDMIWDFSAEIPQVGLWYGYKCIKWDFNLDNGKKFNDPEYTQLMESAKDFIYSLISDPIEGRDIPKYNTVCRYFYCLCLLLKWMINNGYERFSQLDKNSIERYEQYLKNRISKNNGRKSFLQPAYIHLNLIVVGNIYLQREKIEDAIMVDPFDGDTTYERAGMTRKKRVMNKTKRIPDEVAVDLLAKAFNYVEIKSKIILKAMNKIEKIRKDHPDKKFDNRNFPEVVPILKEDGFDNLRDLNEEKSRLRTACYIITAYFSGIRISEGMSIKKGCIEKKKSKDGTDYYLLHSTYYKTVKNPKSSTWLVPEAVVTAIDVLERLTKPWRDDSGIDYLLLNMKKCNNKRSVSSKMNISLNNFVKETGVVYHQGKPWHLSTHQFRTSFAYYMAKENKCNFKFLQEQFKHVSMDMTMWYAITEEEDFELLSEVENAVDEVSLDCLGDIMTPGKNIGGAGGAYISERRDKIFQGMAGEDIIKTLNKYGMDDLYIRSTIYGLCVFNEEHAECNAGFDCLCNPNTCKNAVVTDEYKKHWIELAQRCRELLSRQGQSPLQKAYTQKQLDEFIVPIFKQMKWNLEGLLGNGKEVA
ncbi:MAG TPA: tyrosine-type recombinase/integrase [Nitrospirota bacterium]|nr:tyrosine-type recombinase/integrase [Nitrospirota bacterium]